MQTIFGQLAYCVRDMQPIWCSEMAYKAYDLHLTIPVYKVHMQLITTSAPAM